MNVHDIVVETLSAEAFTPYGWLLAPPFAGSQPPDFQRPGLQNWQIPYHSDAPLRLKIMRYSKQQRQLSVFERHPYVTEARSPIGDAAAILVVAGTTVRDTPPDAGSVRAFYLDGSTGIMFRKGVWHALDCFPARTEHVDYLFLSDAATEEEKEKSTAPRPGRRTDVFDFSASNLAFRITDPKGLSTQ